MSFVQCLNSVLECVILHDLDWSIEVAVWCFHAREDIEEGGVVRNCLISDVELLWLTELRTLDFLLDFFLLDCKLLSLLPINLLADYFFATFLIGSHDTREAERIVGEVIVWTKCEVHCDWSIWSEALVDFDMCDLFKCWLVFLSRTKLQHRIVLDGFHPEVTDTRSSDQVVPLDNLLRFWLLFRFFLFGTLSFLWCAIFRWSLDLQSLTWLDCCMLFVFLCW